MNIEQGLGKTYYERTATASDPKAGPVSKSLLWDFNKSPFKWRHGNPREVSKAMDLGTLIHAATLEPETLENIVIVSPYADFRTKEAREWKAEQAELGKIITSEEEIEKIKEIAGVVLDDYHINFLAEYKTEVAVFGKIGNTEIKGLIDLVPDNLDCLVDLKTTAGIESPEALQRTIVNRGYHWQAALYLDLWNAATGEKRTRFVFCFIETEAPYESAWVELSENLLDIGRAGYMNAVAKWQTCVATNHWPKRIEGILKIETPKYIAQ
jgi:hypothetical protein